MCYEHPWGTKAHTLAVLFLPASIGNFLKMNVVPNADDLVDEPPVQAFTVGSQLAFLVCEPSARYEISSAVLPGELLLTLLPDTPLFIIICLVVGATLAVEFAFESAAYPGIGFKFFAQGDESRCSASRHNGNGRRSKVKTDGIGTWSVFLLLVRFALYSQLHIIAVTLAIRSFCQGTRYFA